MDDDEERTAQPAPRQEMLRDLLERMAREHPGQFKILEPSGKGYIAGAAGPAAAAPVRDPGRPAATRYRPGAERTSGALRADSDGDHG
jgi:hypothetical protein